MRTRRWSFVAAMLGCTAGTAFAQTPPTRILTDLDPCVRGFESRPRQLTLRTPQELLFLADAPLSSVALWKTDGTASGTTRIRSLSSGPSVGPMAAIGTVCVLRVGDRMWSSDGTESGTSALADVEPLAFATSRSTRTTMIFSGRTDDEGEELWLTDGTGVGTVLLFDIVSGATGSNPADFVEFDWTDPVSDQTRELTFFTADDGTNGRELWVTEGTPGSTRLVRNLEPGAGSGTPLDTELVAWQPPGSSDLYVVHTGDTSSTGTELFRLSRRWHDATFTPVSAAEIESGAGDADPAELTLLGDEVVCAAQNAADGRELWAMDAATGTTRLVGNLAGAFTSSSPEGLVHASGLSGFGGAAIYFGATTLGLGRELYRYDGTTTQLLDDVRGGLVGSDARPLAAADGLLWFAAADAAHGRELWSSDGNPGSASLAFDVNSGSASSDPGDAVPFELTSMREVLVFAADAGGTVGREPHRISASSSGRLIADVQPYDACDSNPVPWFSLSDGRLVFRASVDGSSDALWITNGTPAGTTPVNLGGLPSFLLQPAVALDDRTFVFTRLLVTGGPTWFQSSFQLFRSDGVNPPQSLGSTWWETGFGGSLATGEFVEFQDEVYFELFSSSRGRTIWKVSPTT